MEAAYRSFMQRTSFRHPRPAPRPLNILLAEDHVEFRELLARRLERDGAQVECVANGDAALARIFQGRFRPDVVLSDVRMPGKTGVDVLRDVRAAGLTIPIILFTGFGQGGERKAIEAFRGAVLLEKPFDFDDLRTALHNLPCVERLHAR